jgi:hypothetical protein
MSSHAWIPIAVAGTLAVLRWLVPATPRPPAAPPLSDRERATFRCWEQAALVPFFVFATALGLVWYALLRAVAGLAVTADPDTVYLMTPSASSWGVPAIFLGILPSVVPMDWLFRVLLGTRYRRFERSCEERAGVDSRRVCIGLGVAIGVGTALFLLGGLTSVTRITTHGIDVGHAFALKRAFYAYPQVTTIRHLASFRASDGTVVHRPHYVIVFDDGAHWSTRQGLRDPMPAFDAAVMRYVAQRSCRSIEGPQ